MRSRFSAYAMDEVNYLFRTWHAHTRPDDLHAPIGVTWRSLEIVDVVDGGVEDEEGIVEFVAHFEGNEGRDLLHERSRFARRAGRWMYLDGDVTATLGSSAP